jgi:hypothetical protein
LLFHLPSDKVCKVRVWLASIEKIIAKNGSISAAHLKPLDGLLTHLSYIIPAPVTSMVTSGTTRTWQNNAFNHPSNQGVHLPKRIVTGTLPLWLKILEKAK